MEASTILSRLLARETNPKDGGQVLLNLLRDPFKGQVRLRILVVFAFDLPTNMIKTFSSMLHPSIPL